jgi:1,4-alpha-glucan branching enzyme
MANIQVTFIYLTGIRSALFRNPRLSGSWDSNGNYSGDWTSVPMEVITGEDGCPAFTVTVPLSNADPAVTFNWGVVLDCPETPNSWGIASEVTGFVHDG